MGDGVITISEPVSGCVNVLDIPPMEGFTLRNWLAGTIFASRVQKGLPENHSEYIAEAYSLADQMIQYSEDAENETKYDPKVLVLAKEAIKLLSKVEWLSIPNFPRLRFITDERFCVFCGSGPGKGHREHCELHVFLKEAKEEIST